MRCAVSERLGAGLGPGHREWVDALAADGIEMVVVEDHEARRGRDLAARGIDAVLLAEAPMDGRQAPTDVRRSNRHRTERELVRYARSRRLPVVGIGQGAGFLNLYFGGRLCEDPDAAGDRMSVRHLAGDHEVRRAGPLASDPRNFPGVLQAVAWNAHEHITGFVHRDEPILGLHWQPVASNDATARWISGVLRGSHPAHSGLQPEKVTTG